MNIFAYPLIKTMFFINSMSPEYLAYNWHGVIVLFYYFCIFHSRKQCFIMFLVRKWQSFETTIWSVSLASTPKPLNYNPSNQNFFCFLSYIYSLTTHQWKLERKEKRIMNNIKNSNEIFLLTKMIWIVKPCYEAMRFS